MNRSQETSEKIEYMLEQADLIHFQSVFERRFGILKYRGIILSALGGLSLLFFLVWVFSNIRAGIMLQMFLVCFVLLAVYALYIFLYVPASIQLQARRHYTGGVEYSSPRSAEFYAGIMRISRKFTRDTYDLTDFKYCGESMTHFCFYNNAEEARGEVLPKSALTQQQSEQLSADFAELFGKRYFKI